MNVKVKTQLVLPKELLDAVKKAAGKRRSSQFIAEATLEKLATLRFDEAFREAAGTWGDEKHPELKTLGSVRRYIRGLRDEAQRRGERRMKTSRG